MSKREKAQIRNWKIARFHGTPLLTSMMPIEVLDKLTNKEVEILDFLQKKLRNLLVATKKKKFICGQCATTYSIKHSDNYTKNKKAIECDYCHSWATHVLYLVRN